MQKRPLGASGVEVPVVTFGAWAIGGWAWGGSDDDAALEALSAGLDAGMVAIDTAPVYGFGRSEELVGRALAGRRDSAVVMTKVGLVWEDRRGEFAFEAEQDGRRLAVYRNARPDSIRREVDASLTRLDVEMIDLVQLHWPDPTTPVAESMGALVDLLHAGKLRAIGVSNFTPALLEEAQAALGEVPLACTQERFSLIAQDRAGDVLPWVRERDVGFLAYSPLEQGLLTGKVDPQRRFAAGDARAGKTAFSAANRKRVNRILDKTVRPLAEQLDVSAAQVVIAWTFAQPGVTSALVGARSAEQARENARAGSLLLDEQQVASISRAFARLELVPGGMRGLLKRALGSLRPRS